jgi:ABC-type nitrate/sulfonate/bicarbonate transport system substrate-binding protein
MMKKLKIFDSSYLTSQSKKRLFASAVAAFAGVILTACATVEETADAAGLEPVVMQFDWIFNAQFAGFFQAIEQGYYADAGIVVELRGGITTARTVPATLEEPAISFGSTESNVLLGDVSAGADAVALGTMFQDSPMGWMYLKDGAVGEFADLAKLRVGIHADGARVIALLLEQQGVDTTDLVTFDASHDPQQILDDQADALQCYYIDEFVKFQQLVGENAGIFLARDFGYQAYSQVMFTAAATVEQHPEIVAGFLAATKRGWEYAFEYPEATVDLILTKYNDELDRDYQIRSLAKIEELMVPEPSALFRPMEASVLEKGQQHLLKYNLIPKLIDIDALLVQQFLP